MLIIECMLLDQKKKIVWTQPLSQCNLKSELYFLAPAPHIEDVLPSALLPRNTEATWMQTQSTSLSTLIICSQRDGRVQVSVERPKLQQRKVHLHTGKKFSVLDSLEGCGNQTQREVFLCTHLFPDQEKMEDYCPFDRLSAKLTVQGFRVKSEHSIFFKYVTLGG